MNETIKNILERRSIRSYLDKPVPHELIEEIVKCGKFAATGLGKQPWFFSVVESREALDKISAANKKLILAMPEGPMTERAKDPNFHSFFHAPAAVIVSRARDNERSVADCANAVENMAVAAWSLGIASCYLGSFKLSLLEPEGAALCEALRIPGDHIPEFALALGYAGGEPPERVPRREDNVVWIK